MIWIGNARDIELTAREAYKLTVCEKKYKDVMKEVFSHVNKGIDCSIREHMGYSSKVAQINLEKILESHGMMSFMDRVMNDIVGKYRQLGYFVTLKESFVQDSVIIISWSERDLARLRRIKR